MGITYFGEGKDDRYFERLMQEKPGRESAGQRKRVHLLRCENCSAFMMNRGKPAVCLLADFKSHSVLPALIGMESVTCVTGK